MGSVFGPNIEITGGQLGTSRWLVAAAGIAVTVGGGTIAVASDDELVLGKTVPLTGAHKRSGTDTPTDTNWLFAGSTNGVASMSTASDIALWRAITTTTPTR